jgi:hypothetical protein
MHPTDIPSFRATLLLYEPAPDHAERIYAAQAAASPVLACVTTFDALKAVPDLMQDGLTVLLGAAHLIAAGGWHGLAGEAANVLAQRAGQLLPVVNNEPAQP